LLQYPDLPEGASVSEGEDDLQANAERVLGAVSQMYIDAHRLGIYNPQVDRLLDLAHSSKQEPMEAAFRELGRRLDISIA
jgi:antitoxin HicB